MELSPQSSSCSSTNSVLSEIEVYPIENTDNEGSDCDTDRAWGNVQKAFYDGNEQDDDLECEEAQSIQARFSTAMKEDDFSTPWLKTDESDRREVSKALSLKADVEELVLEKTIKSFHQNIVWFQKQGVHFLDQCREKCFTADGNAYIQAKAHLSFCYGLNVLYYLVSKLNKPSSTDHLGVQQIKAVCQVLSDKIETALLHPTSSIEPGSRVSTKSVNVLKHHHTRNRQTVDKSKGHTEMKGKRDITYEIATNKGIKPKRKKEQRNPRVKHRNKYRKALIKRKSQVLPVVHEVFKYGGETSGIRSKVARSVQIK